MSLLLRLKPMVLHPAIAINELEWRRRWKKDSSELLAALDIEDLGGLDTIVESVQFWQHGAVVQCKECGQDKRIDELRVDRKYVRPICKDCHRRKEHERQRRTA